MTVSMKNEFLSFSVGTEEFCIDILKVREIRGYSGVTKLPNSSPDLPGVINLRGIIVPLVDLRVRFGITAPAYDALTIVIVLAIDSRVIGIVVDGVSEVVALGDDEVKLPPTLQSVSASSITGMATVGERMVMIIDIDRLLSCDATPCDEGVGVPGNEVEFAKSA